MKKVKIAVLVSGGGTNLQALLDSQKSGVIKNGEIIEKKTLSLPEKLVNVITCKNPRCITTTEQELEHVFVLTDSELGVYRCLYCEAEAPKA